MVCGVARELLHVCYCLCVALSRDGVWCCMSVVAFVLRCVLIVRGVHVGACRQLLVLHLSTL